MENKRLKIGLFMDNFYPSFDGVVVVMDNLAKELSKDHDVTVVVPSMKDSKEIDMEKPYKVIRVKSIKFPFADYRAGLVLSKKSSDFKKLVNEGFDIIHIHSPFAVGMIGIRLAKYLNIPCIATLHTRFDCEIERVIKSKKTLKFVMKKIMNIFNKCDVCTVVNDPLIEEMKGFGYKKEPVVIYNGTDLKPVENKNKSIKNINKKYRIKDKENVFIFVGRIVECKNIFFILDSLKLLKEDGIKFKMFYIGDGMDFQKLKDKIKKYDMEDMVITPGKIMDRNLLSSLYARADLLLFPSIMDTSSLVRIEAAVNETPGIYIKDSMVGYTIEDNVSGFLSELDVVKYKDKIKSVLENKKLLEDVSKNAKEILGKGWEEITKEFYDLYVKELNKKR